VIDCLERNKSFVVDAGAGSGKTYTLVEALTYLLKKRSKDYLSRGQQIVCITYTNVAVDEIKSRINSDPLVRVSTIHDFLWSVICDHQEELRKCVLEANEKNEEDKRIADLDLTSVPIVYWQYGRKWKEGKIHHDDVISFASKMFLSYPKLSRLVADRYPVIFVDEYQDTQRQVVDLLLDSLPNEGERRVTLGFFGDHMQKIYGTGVGKLERPELEPIQKVENYRCSTEVIRVLNNLRPALQQVAAGERTLRGSAQFFYSQDQNASLATLQERLHDEGWESGEKVLMLTHRFISKSLGWDNIRTVYANRNRFALENLLRKDDAFSEMFQTIEDAVAAFDGRRYGELYSLLSIRHRKNDERFSDPREYKLHFSQVLGQLRMLCRSATIGQVLDHIWDNKLMTKTSRMIRLEDRGRTEDHIRNFIDDLRSTPYAEVSALYRYLNNETPFSTKHGTKGEEYNDVIVVINDRSWNQYNFASVLETNRGKSQYERSLNLFYVCCSRAKHNLAVLMESKVTDETIAGARRIFGDENVIEL
jgi:DNA helicase II